MTNCSAVRSLINVMAYSVRNRTCRDPEIPQRPADSSQLSACPLSTTSSSTTFTMVLSKLMIGEQTIQGFGKTDGKDKKSDI